MSSEMSTFLTLQRCHDKLTERLLDLEEQPRSSSTVDAIRSIESRLDAIERQLEQFGVNR